MFSENIETVLDRYGVLPETKTALYDLYLALGSDVLEAFADLAETRSTLDDLFPEDLVSLRDEVTRRYVRRHHAEWLAGRPSPSYWHPRLAEGRAAGLLTPLGQLGAGSAGEISSLVELAARRLVGPGQPVPRGVLVLGRNAHFGGRSDTISFDVVELDFDGAMAIALSAGRQHTIPGSVGECSGTFDAGRRLALIWELQPNVLKPTANLNRPAARVYRKHRNWHVITFVTALLWLTRVSARIFVVRGPALRATHQVNPRQPISATISELHDRTIERVVSGVGGALGAPTNEETEELLDAWPGNVSLRRHLDEAGIAESLWRVDLPAGFA